MKGNHAEIRIFPNKKKSSYGLQKKILTTKLNTKTEENNKKRTSHKSEF